MRTFLGVDLEKKLKKEIYDLQQQIKKYTVKGRWKYIDNFHLTLKFLDEISPSQKMQIDQAMHYLSQYQKPFNLKLAGLGIFSGKNSIRVLWLGLTGDIPALNQLYEGINESLVPLNFPREKRRFRPHITIGQDIIFQCDWDQIKATLGEVELGIQLVDRFYLFKSEQVLKKRVYTKISEYKFS